MADNYVIGLDFGTDSVRAVLVNAADGLIVSTAVHDFERWRQGKYCDPTTNRFRQHPLDHIEGMEITIKKVVNEANLIPSEIKGICIDTTGSSPLPMDNAGIPLALKPEFEDNPNAMVILWKDHTATAEAAEINELNSNWGGVDYSMDEGGIYSSEWFWAKILHVIREDHKVKEHAWTWMEHCDLMPFMLTGSKNLETFKRSRCAAGHKAMWSEKWEGLPSDDFLARLDPYLAALKQRLYRNTYTSDQPAGTLCNEWAVKLGLTEQTVVAVGTFDAHAGALGAEIEEFTLVRVMGTSTCDILVSSNDSIRNHTVKGICGQVDGSVIPGMTGLEAGQSAFGDLLSWFKDILSWPIDNTLYKSELISEDQKTKLSEELKSRLIEELTEEAKNIPAHDTVPLALDWINGRRTPDADQTLKAAITSLSLGTTAPHIFKALVEAICFGSKKIIERFIDEGITINAVIGIGGVAQKSPFIMQTLANVLNMPIKIAVTEQAPALGAAMYAAVAAGIYPATEDARNAMGNGFDKTYIPEAESVELYNKQYEQYKMLGDYIEQTSKLA